MLMLLMHIVYNSGGKNDCQKMNSISFLEYIVNINMIIFL